jgi:hypothetical protein
METSGSSSFTSLFEKFHETNNYKNIQNGKILSFINLEPWLRFKYRLEIAQRHNFNRKLASDDFHWAIACVNSLYARLVKLFS